jgi:hypothetical protein
MLEYLTSFLSSKKSIPNPESAPSSLSNPPESDEWEVIQHSTIDDSHLLSTFNENEDDEVSESITSEVNVQDFLEVEPAQEEPAANMMRGGKRRKAGGVKKTGSAFPSLQHSGKMSRGPRQIFQPRR